MTTGADYEFLVRTLARRYARREADLEDCEQEARIAVLSGLRDWRPETGKISRKNYVAFRIKHALKEYVRSRYRPGLVSLDEDVGDFKEESGGVSRHEVIGAPPSQEEAAHASRVAERIDRLPHRLREILQMRGERMTQEEIANELGISQQRVDQLNRKALDQIGDAA
jgi:RNA polymerase sigma factor (sigma-70 family)